MKKCLLSAVLLATASMSHAASVLVGTDNSGTNSRFVGNQADLSTDSSGNLDVFYGNVGWAQEFSVSQAIDATDVSVFVQDNNVPASFNLEITDSLASNADILFSGTGNFGGTSPTWVDLSLGSLDLGVGNYYLVMTSGTAVPILAPDGSNCPVAPPTGPNALTVSCFETGEWGGNGTDISTEGSVGQLYLGVGGGANDSPGLGLTAISIASPGNTEFQLTGTGASTPEPGTLVLLMGGALALLAKRRFAR
jgi:hypothetical protein